MADAFINGDSRADLLCNLRQLSDLIWTRLGMSPTSVDPDAPALLRYKFEDGGSQTTAAPCTCTCTCTCKNALLGDITLFSPTVMVNSTTIYRKKDGQGVTLDRLQSHEFKKKKVISWGPVNRAASPHSSDQAC